MAGCITSATVTAATTHVKAEVEEQVAAAAEEEEDDSDWEEA